MFVAPAGFVHYDYTKMLPRLEREVMSLEKFIILEDLGKKYKYTCKGPKYVEYEKYLKQYRPDASALPKVKISPHDIVNVQFTSGSKSTKFRSSNLGQVI